MNQSLRTVTTQLLNVTDANEPNRSPSDSKNDPNRKGTMQKLMTIAKIEKVDKSSEEKNKLIAEEENTLIKHINEEISSLEAAGVGFGRPMNSKFGYFESSHPGEAMAMTDEELEKEMSSKRDTVANKNRPTTSGGISTWILLNPPTTTPRAFQPEPMKKAEPVNKLIAKPTAIIEKVVHTKATAVKITPVEVKNNVTGAKNNQPKGTTTTTTRPEKIRIPVTKTTPKPVSQRVPETTVSASTTTQRVTTIASPSSTEKINPAPVLGKPSASAPPKRIPQVQRTPKPKPNLSTTTAGTVTKNPRPNLNRVKFPTRTTTTTTTTIPSTSEKTSTPKIERVTFKPVQMIPTPENEVKTEKPIFITKMKTSVLTNVQRPTQAPPTKTTTPKVVEDTTTTKTDFNGSDLIEVPSNSKPPMTKPTKVVSAKPMEANTKPIAVIDNKPTTANTKPIVSNFGNNAKIQVKKPIDEMTEIEIEPIKINPPILKIERVPVESNEAPNQVVVPNESSGEIVSPALDIPPPMGTKLETTPEMTQVELQSSPGDLSTSTTTKKPRRSSQKRKKNKNKRRRKPSSTTTSTTVSPISNELTNEAVVTDLSVQESKVEPESKVANATKNKKQAANKQVEKPIGTQIYNYLSREIMPSFGMVSLVGLGLGIASYFLYPFGGGIARRNYEVEPNYKYDLGEYGGNYGQSEEEVFSKVIQGMTNHEAKYNGGGSSDYNRNNYYRYQKFGGPTFTEAKVTKKSDQRYPPTPLGVGYKPLENTYDLKYRNTEFKYPEVPTTANYFERQQQSGYTVASDDDANRHFVVGNVPKEYTYDETPVIGQKKPSYPSNHAAEPQFERDVVVTPSYFQESIAIDGVQTHVQPEAQPLKNDEKYEEIEITPTAVAVEHGPRALKVKRSVDEESLPTLSRFRRESVIQIIPPNESKELEEPEEDLSNEIFDILGSMIPGKENARKVKDTKTFNDINEDPKSEKKIKKNVHSDDTDGNSNLVEKKAEETSSVVPSTTKDTVKDEPTTPTTTTKTPEITTTSTPVDPTSETTSSEKEVKDAEDTTLESIDVTTEKTDKEEEPGFNIFNFVRKVAEIKFRLGLTILKHASEGFARYLGGVQKRLNGEE